MIWLLAATALAAKPGLDRVDLIAGGPGTFVNYDVPNFGANTSASLIRFVEQVQPVWRSGAKGLQIGTSINSQSLIYNDKLADNITWLVALETSLGAPRGVRAGVAYRAHPVRFEVGCIGLTPSGWRRFDYDTWNVMPTLAFGLTRQTKKAQKKGKKKK